MKEIRFLSIFFVFCLSIIYKMDLIYIMYANLSSFLTFMSIFILNSIFGKCETLLEILFLNYLFFNLNLFFKIKIFCNTCNSKKMFIGK